MQSLKKIHAWAQMKVPLLKKCISYVSRPIVIKLHVYNGKCYISLCLIVLDIFNIKLPYLFLFDLILYVPSTIFQLNRDGSSWVEQVLS